jgi:hypothetical protein
VFKEASSRTRRPAAFRLAGGWLTGLEGCDGRIVCQATSGIKVPGKKCARDRSPGGADSTVTGGPHRDRCS